MTDRIVFCRFFFGYTDTFPFDRFVGLKDGDIEGELTTMSKEWLKSPANRKLIQASRVEQQRVRKELEARAREWRKAGLARPGINSPALRTSKPRTETPPTVPTGEPSIEEIASVAGWRDHRVPTFKCPFGISRRYPAARFGEKELASDVAVALQERADELARTVWAKLHWSDQEYFITSACPRFFVVAEQDLSGSERIGVREKLHRLHTPAGEDSSLEERCLRNYWPTLLPLLDQFNPPPVPQPPETPFTRLKVLAEEAMLAPNEARIVTMICTGGGKAPLGDLALKLGWENAQDNWNSARRRLNTKLKKHGWTFNTSRNCAVAKELPKPVKK